MAAAFFNAVADPARARAASAGTQPADQIDPVVITAMDEAGIDIRGGRPRRLDDDLAREAQVLITMGCGDQCPHVQEIERLDWPLSDPQGLRLPAVREIRDDIQNRVLLLVTSRGW